MQESLDDEGWRPGLVDLVVPGRVPWLRVGRAVAVSIVATVISQLMLYVAIVVLGAPASLANVGAVAVSTWIGYQLSARWVWPDAAELDHIHRVAFVGQALLGLVASTITVAVAVRLWGPWAALPVSAVTWAALWPVGFVICEHYVFPAERACARTRSRHPSVSAV